MSIRSRDYNFQVLKNNADRKTELDIVVPTRNRHYRFPDAIKNFSECTNKRIRVILVDSTDLIYDLSQLKETISTLKNLNEINYYNTKLNIAEARQFGIDHADTEFVCMTDDDEKIRKGTLDHLCSLIKKSVTIGMIAGVDTTWSRYLYSQHKNKKGGITDAIEVKSWFDVWILRNSMFKQGLVRYDKSFFGQEDRDLCIQTWLAGYRVLRSLKSKYRKVYANKEGTRRIPGGSTNYYGNTIRYKNHLTNHFLPEKYSFVKMRKNGSLVYPLKMLKTFYRTARSEKRDI